MQVILRQVFDGSEEDIVYIDEARFLIGRSHACQLRLAGAIVSRQHCEIAVEYRRVTVRDLESKNGTYVNCQRVEHIRELKSGDVLNVGLAFYEVSILETIAKKRKKPMNLQRLCHPFAQWQREVSVHVCT